MRAMEQVLPELIKEPGDLQNFIEQFPVFAAAPGGVFKLREMILKLAVAGKLHDFVPGSNSADLLVSLRQQKSDLIKAKKIRKGKLLPEVDGGLFEIPAHWVWAFLGEWGDWGAGATPSRSKPGYFGGSIPWFKSGELTGGIIVESQETITDEAVKESAVKLCSSGDVLLAMYGATIGKVAILGVQATTNQAVCACTCFDGVDNNFLLLLLKAYNSYFTNQGAGGAQPNISREKIINTPAPLPPLEEQKRIVAKVDELMGLCDQLETQQQQQANTILRANTAAINALLNSDKQSTETPAEAPTSSPASLEPSGFEKSWQRIAQHFNTLYGCTLPMPPGEGRQKKHLVGLENLANFKRLIFQLAVMGKLVTQFDSDVSANELLEEISVEKSRLLKEKLIRKTQTLFPEVEKLEPYSLPNGWAWSNLGSLCSILVDGSHNPPPKQDDGIPMLTGRNIQNGEINFESPRFISEESYLLEYERTPIQEGDVLLTIIGSIGRTAVVPQNISKFVLQRNVAHLRSMIDPFYLANYFQSLSAIDFFESNSKGTAQKAIYLNQIAKLPISVPPIEEQKRIVGKIDELMALCDQLEQHLKQAYGDAEKLMEATVKALVA